MRELKNLEGLQLQCLLWGGLFYVACFLNDTCWQPGGDTFWWAVRFIEMKLPTVATTSPGDTITVLTSTSVDLRHYLTCVAEERVCCCPLSPGGGIVAALLCTSSSGIFCAVWRSASFECPWMTSPTHKCQKERHCVARTLWMFGSGSCRSDDGAIACANILCSDIILPRFNMRGCQPELFSQRELPLAADAVWNVCGNTLPPPMNNRKQLISSWSVPVICDEPQTPEWRIAGPEKEQKTAHARSKRQTWETRKPQSHLKTVSEDSCAIVVCADKTIIRQRMKWQKHYSLWQNIFSFHLGWTFRSLKVWLPAMFSYVYWPSFQLNVTLVMCHSVIALQRVKVYFFDHHFFSTQGAAVGVKATAAVLLLLILAIQWNLSHELSHYSLSVRFYCVLSNSCDFLS